ncbi:MAG TPA: C-terminal binding protein [Syntrophomonadaceae bacterium]|nr:C-terminal binding protein [Syntrophomonadaceae bacterium]HOQ09393.1 C-terminal binding protein [Syntrophomonadaceae bacterium]HPU48337.1 C-terminal binding protein [Syntrophomonadaceae bacterium]
MTTSLKVVITDFEYESLRWEEEAVAQAGAEFVKCQCRTEEELIEATRDADALLVQYAHITSRVMDHMQKCRAIVRYGVGLDCIDVEAATKHGIMVANIPDYGLEDIADHAIALMLTSARKIVQLNQYIHQGQWDYKLAKPLFRLRGKTLGLVGFGRIARMVADKAKAFGMQVIAYDPYVDPDIAASYQVKLVDFETVLGSADVLSLHVPVSEDTIHLINEEALAKMKDNCLLVNTARGALVDEKALIKALRTAKIAGAALDVSEKEPIDPDNELLSLPNVVITPHSAWYTEEAQQSLQQQAAQEILRVLRGERPLNLVNPAVLTKM